MAKTPLKRPSAKAKAPQRAAKLVKSKPAKATQTNKKLGKDADRPKAVRTAERPVRKPVEAPARKLPAAARVAPISARPAIPEAMREAPVPTDSKPRKNQAGFMSRELEFFRDILLAKRGEIVGDMSSMEREALRESGNANLSTLPIHMADMGTDNYEQEFTLELVETERKLLREINNALAKIQNGAFGICEGTGKPISKARLEVQPWARYSIDYAKKLERGHR